MALYFPVFLSLPVFSLQQVATVEESSPNAGGSIRIVYNNNHPMS
jgi:hypothetical protein